MLIPQTSTMDRRNARRVATHRNIMDAAERLVLAEGTSALTTKKLVEVAEVSERTIFNHFTDLDEILLTRLGEHLAGVINTENFPEDLELADIPQASEEYICKELMSETSHEPLDSFIELASVFMVNHDTLEDIGFEVFRTLTELSIRLIESIKAKYQQITYEYEVPLALYIQNMCAGLSFGLMKYAMACQDKLEPPYSYSNEEIRANMVWAVQQVSAGQPKFQGASPQD